MTWGTVELESEVLAWLEWLTAPEFATVAHYVDLLVSQGPHLDEPYTRHLDRNLRELRFYLDGQAVRLTYWVTAGKRITLLAVTHRKHDQTRHTWTRRIGEEQTHISEQHSVDDESVVVMADRKSWKALRRRRMAEPGAADAYEATRLAFDLGATVRELREQHGWSQQDLARAAGLTPSAVARFELGGSTPSVPVLERFAQALDVELVVRFSRRKAA